MTPDPLTTLPPRWAEALLRMLLTPAERESVSGDVLEEYRRSIVPALGRDADRWYIRQVAGYVLRRTWIVGALVAGVLVTRYLLDTLAPVQYTRGVIHPRSSIMSWGLIGIFAVNSARQAWRSRDVRSGVVVAFATAVFGGALAVSGTLICLAIWHDADTLRAIQGSGGLDEALWGVALQLIPIGLFTGTAGAVTGRVLHSIVDGVSGGGK